MPDISTKSIIVSFRPVARIQVATMRRLAKLGQGIEVLGEPENLASFAVRSFFASLIGASGWKTITALILL